MRKRKNRTLKLVGDTLRTLNEAPLRKIAGGATDYTACLGGCQHTPMTEYPQYGG